MGKLNFALPVAAALLALLAPLVCGHTTTIAGAPLPVAMRQFPLSAVRPTPGSRIYVQQQRNTRYLLAFDSSKLLCGYTAAANLTGTYEHPTCEFIESDGWQHFAGHYVGHWLSAAALTVESGGDPTGALAVKAAAVVDVLASCQTAWTALGPSTRGFLFPYNTNDFWPAPRAGSQPGVPFYIAHKMLAGLLDVALRLNSTQALDMAAAMGLWVKARAEMVLAEDSTGTAWQDALQDEWGGINESLFALFRVTGDPAFRDAAYLFDHLAWTAPLAAGVDRIGIPPNNHANTHIP